VRRTKGKVNGEPGKEGGCSKKGKLHKEHTRRRAIRRHGETVSPAFAKSWVDGGTGSPSDTKKGKGREGEKITQKPFFARKRNTAFRRLKWEDEKKKSLLGMGGPRCEFKEESGARTRKGKGREGKVDSEGGKRERQEKGVWDRKRLRRTEPADMGSMEKGTVGNRNEDPWPACPWPLNYDLNIVVRRKKVGYLAAHLVQDLCMRERDIEEEMRPNGLRTKRRRIADQQGVSETRQG